MFQAYYQADLGGTFRHAICVAEQSEQSAYEEVVRVTRLSQLDVRAVALPLLFILLKADPKYRLEDCRVTYDGYSGPCFPRMSRSLCQQ